MSASPGAVPDHVYHQHAESGNIGHVNVRICAVASYVYYLKSMKEINLINYLYNIVNKELVS